MKKLIALLAIIGLLACVQRVQAQDEEPKDTTEMWAPEDSSAFAADSVMAALDAELGEPDAEAAEEGGGLHKQLKRKFIEGSAAERHGRGEGPLSQHTWPCGFHLLSGTAARQGTPRAD